MRGAMDGRRATLKSRLAPAGEIQVRPRRPRPAVCQSATTARPSPPASRRAARARSLVEGISAWNSTARPIRRAESAACDQSTGSVMSGIMPREVEEPPPGGLPPRLHATLALR